MGAELFWAVFRSDGQLAEDENGLMIYRDALDRDYLDLVIGEGCYQRPVRITDITLAEPTDK